MARTLFKDHQPGVSSNGSTAAPTPLALASPTRRRPSWVVAGVALVAVAALLGAWVFSTTTSTMRVVVAAHDLSPGAVPSDPQR